MATTNGYRPYWRVGFTFGDMRNIAETLGYKETRDLTYADYKERYERNGLAHRLLNLFPESTWKHTPKVLERNKQAPRSEQGLTQESPFETQVQAITERLQLNAVMKRLDILASLGRYAVLFIGVRGQTNLSTPMVPLRSPDDILYLSTYSEEHAQIRAFDTTNTASFGRPLLYEIDFNRKNDLTHFPTAFAPSETAVLVHASRVIHVAKNGMEDDICGTPDLLKVWNYLDDLDKVLGGSAEMFWKDAKRRFVLNLNSDAEMSDEETAKLDDRVDRFGHQLLDVLKVQGMDVELLAGTITDPSNHIDKIVDVIAGTWGVPKRKLLGTERGELASGQDERNWAEAVMGYMLQMAEPLMLRPFLDWATTYGGIPAPQDGYEIGWPDLLEISAKEKAEVALSWARVFATIAGTMGAPLEVITLGRFMEDFVGYTKEEVEEIIKELDQQILDDAQMAHDTEPEADEESEETEREDEEAA